MAYFENTTIPNDVLNALKAEDPGKYTRLVNSLSTAIANNNSREANEAIFGIAYFSQQKPGSEEYGRGQGNPNVSKVHSGHWRLNTGVVDNYMPWAAEHVNSSDATYKQYNGDIITYDDQKGAAINGKIVDWGQRAHTEQGGKMGVENPYVGQDAAPPTNPSFVGGATNTDLGAIWPNVDWTGGEGDAGGKTGPEQYPYWTSVEKTRGPVTAPEQEQISLLGYRPQSLDYWKEYVPTESRGLIEMSRQLQPEYSLAYQPGEFRDPTSWKAGAGGGGTGHIPGGQWRRATYNPATAANLAAGTSGYTAAGHPVQNPWARDTTGAYTKINAPGWGTWGTATGTNPWDFTSPAMGTNIAWKPWDAADMNVTGAANTNWEGLLADIDTSPTMTPGLLTTGKGGPITFDGKVGKGSVYTVDN
jgi:hypothetical protein